ncbi:glycoprotein endo-alpha-1,2-mannosidase [Phlebotomus argentipes]|uniref:glycoprotein endo-alpha-1,2-mannosidase n=1 Tax=Phlebotomus argentipes TaxID=94469 RepID=UPI002892F465|nr:glycoprotein endo-alpha-1,2-mannosidase [Phlebotomus argentipes]
MTFLKLFKATKMMKLVPLGIIVTCIVIFVTRVEEKSVSTAKIEINPIPITSLVTPKSVTTEAKRVPIVPEKYNEANVRTRLMQEKIRRLMARNHEVAREETGQNGTELTRHVHIFYYAPVKWFRDGRNSSRDRRETPNIIFYPARGLYTPSREIFQEHCREIRGAGIGVLVISWTPAFSVNLLRVLMNVSRENNLTVAVSIDTYPGRSVDSVEKDIRFFCDTFSDFLHRFHVSPRNSPMAMFYIKEPFVLPWTEWRTMRRSCDALLIGHISAKEHTSLARRAGFDGFYTLLGSNGATYASTWKHWQHLNAFATQYRMLFIPSVAPGFAERKRSMRQRHRSNGQYYGVAWRTAIRLGVPVISVSSYNDWPHGDQIEDAVSRVGFKDYSTASGKTHKYLHLTAHWIDEFRKERAKNPPGTCSALFNNTICL